MMDTMEIQRYTQAVSLLPPRLRPSALRVSLRVQTEAEEFRLRSGQKLGILLPEGEIVPPGGAEETTVRAEDLEEMVDGICEYARYASMQMLKNGYLTAQGGFRAGICGTAVLRDGENCTLRDISSLALRIVREKIGIADALVGKLFADGYFQSTLLLSPPGGGKTTLLRDLIRLLSNGDIRRKALRVAVVDERGEIAVCRNGAAQMMIGEHTDVLDGCPKALGIRMLLRAMNPQVIAVDEIAEAEDVSAIVSAANCGCALLASMHGGSVEELQRKPIYRSICETGVFRRIVVIGKNAGERCYRVEEMPECNG